MNPNQLGKEIASGKFRTAYYFFGSEDYRMVEAEKFMAAKFLSKETLTTSYRRFNGRKIKAAELITELSVYPMLGERQVFSIVDFQSYKPTEIKRILSLLTPPDPNRIIIFSTPSARTPKKKSAFITNISKVAGTVEFGKLDSREARSNISSKLTKASLTIAPDALERLVGLLDGNRGALDSEVEKLINFKQNGDEQAGQITTADIDLVATGYEVFSVFELAELVVTNNIAKALQLITHMLADGNSATGLVFHLCQHFLSLYKVKNGKPLEVYRRFLESRFRAQAAKYSMAELERIITLLAQTDAGLRRDKIKGQIALEALIVQISKRS